MSLAGWAIAGAVVGYILCAVMGGRRGYISFVLTFAAAGIAVGFAFRLLHALWAILVVVALVAIVGAIVSAVSRK